MPWLLTSKKGLVTAMEISVEEMRSAIVGYYEDNGYSHKDADAHVPHSPDHILWIYNKIQEEKKLPPNDTRSNPLLLE